MESGGRPSLGQFILLGTSSVVTAFLYSVYRQKAQVVRELKVSARADVASAGWSLPPVMVSPGLSFGPPHCRKRAQRGNGFREGVTQPTNGGTRIRIQVS